MIQRLKQLKQHKRWLLMVSVVGVAMILSACARGGANHQPIGPDYDGLWEGLIWYFSRFIIWSSDLFGGNYGIGIIIITLISRILLIPLTNMQQKNMSQMTELQPEIEALKEKYSATDSKTKEKLQEETQKLYDEHGVNPLMGCLPMLIQMPIFIAVYSAVSRTPELATGSFLWVNLGQPDPYYILPLLAGLFMFANTYLMQMGRDNSGMGGKVMSIVMPAFIILITVNLSSGLALYFVASNIFAVIQTLVFNNPFKKRREAKEEAERKAAEEQRRKRAIKKAKKYGRNIKK